MTRNDNKFFADIFRPQTTGYASIGMSFMKCPRTWMTEAFLVALFMFLPLGIAAMVYSSKVENRYALGRFEEAEEASRKAHRLIIWGVGVGIIFWLTVGWLLLTGTLHPDLLTLTI